MMVLAGVFRKKDKAWGKNAVTGYLLHGSFAVTALWMFMEAVAQ
jgi:hypothetical protein